MATPGAGQLAATTYASAFVSPSVRPRDALSSIQGRLRGGRVLNDELADYFAARREAEEAYVKALHKLQKKSFLSDRGNLPPSLSPVWERLTGEITEMASIHADLERKLATECEDAVRSAPHRGAWAAVRDYDDRLSNVVKELNSLETQLGKDAKKLDSASGKKAQQAQQKVADVQRAIDETGALWQSEAAGAFRIYQKIDKERLDLLKEVVTRFETAAADAAQRRMAVSEQTMQVCLNEFDVEADMQEYALREGNASAVVRAGTAGASASASAGAGQRPSRGGSGAEAPAPPSRLQRSASNATARTDATSRTSATREGGGGGRAARADMPPPPLPAPRKQEVIGMPASMQPPSTVSPEAALIGTGAAAAAAGAGAGALARSNTSVHSATDRASSRRNVPPPAPVDAPSSAKGGAGSSSSSTGGGGGGAGSSFKNAFSRFGLGRKNSDNNATAAGSGSSTRDAGNTTYGTLGDGDADEERESSFFADATIRRANAAAATAAGGAGQPPRAPPKKKGSMLDDDDDDDAPLSNLVASGSGGGLSARSRSGTGTGSGAGAGAGAGAGGPPRLMDPLQPSKVGANGAAAPGGAQAQAQPDGSLGISGSTFGLDGASAGAGTGAGAGASSATGAAAGAPLVDSEGYSIPPPDRKPWELGQADDDEDTDFMPSMAAPNRVSTMNITSGPSAPSNSAADQQALEKLRATLGAPKAAPTRRNTTSRRDRRDVRNTVYSPTLGEESRPMSQFGLGALTIPEGGEASAAAATNGMTASPIAATPSQSLFAAKSPTSDGRTQSMLSNASAPRAAADPFANSPTASGVSTAITETVNVLFSGKELAKIMVVGEVSVSLRDVRSTEPVHIRIDAFEQLEKAAPNPAFLEAIYAKPGEYKLDVAALLAQGPGDGSAQATILKYQLHVSEDPVSRKRYLPLEVSAQWRCEDTQTSLLLSYVPNTESKLLASPGDGDALLSGLSFVVGIAPSNVQSVMSKPSGTWVAETKKMQWVLSEEVPLSVATPQKVLARFQVDSKSVPQPVGVRWAVRGRTLSALGVSVVPDSTTAPSSLEIAQTARQCVAGKFLAGP